MTIVFFSVVKTSESSLLLQLFEENNDKYDFCMCNPPFYSSVQELIESRSPARYSTSC